MRGDRVPRVARPEHTTAKHHLESVGHDEQLLVPLQGALISFVRMHHMTLWWNREVLLQHAASLGATRGMPASTVPRQYHDANVK